MHTSTIRSAQPQISSPWFLWRRSVAAWLLIFFQFFPVYGEETLVPSGYITSLLGGYSQEMAQKIHADYARLVPFCLNEKVGREKIYLATAGGPCASKSTILEQYLKEHALNKQEMKASTPTETFPMEPRMDAGQKVPFGDTLADTGFAYIDSDQRVLKFMYGYQESLGAHVVSQQESFRQAVERASLGWEKGASFIAYSLLNKAFALGLNIAHGTSSTEVHVEGVYQKLKKRGYRITLLLCFSPPESASRLLMERASRPGSFRVKRETLQEETNKFYQRLPIYLKYADEVRLYYTSGRRQPPVHVGTYTPKDGLKVMAKGLGKIRRLYEKYQEAHGGSPSFESLIPKITPALPRLDKDKAKP